MYNFAHFVVVDNNAPGERSQMVALLLVLLLLLLYLRLLSAGHTIEVYFMKNWSIQREINIPLQKKRSKENKRNESST